MTDRHVKRGTTWEWLQMSRILLTTIGAFVLEVREVLISDHVGEGIGLGLFLIVALEVALRRFSDPEPAAV